MYYQTYNNDINIDSKFLPDIILRVMKLVIVMGQFLSAVATPRQNMLPRRSFGREQSDEGLGNYSGSPRYGVRERTVTFLIYPRTYLKPPVTSPLNIHAESF